MCGPVDGACLIDYGIELRAYYCISGSHLLYALLPRPNLWRSSFKELADDDFRDVEVKL